MPEFKVERKNVSFWLRVKPRAPRERLSVDASGELRLELQAPATEGQANEACIHFFARALRLPHACVVILSGHKARRKLLRVTGHSAEESIERISALAAMRVRQEGGWKLETQNSKSARLSTFDFRVSDSPREGRSH